MQIRNYSPRTIHNYLASISRISLHYGISPDKLTVEQIKDYLQKRIDADRIQILIRSGKGKKTRYSLLGQRTLDLLRDYWKRYRPHDYLFPGQTHGRPLSERTVEVVFKQAMKLAKINKPAYFHCNPTIFSH